MKLGNILRIAIDQSNYTVAKLAKKLDVTDRTVYRWLNNTNEPDFEMLCKLCMVLNIDFNDIIKINNNTKVEMIHMAQNIEELELLQAYRELDTSQKKLFKKNMKIFLELIHLNKT